MSLTSSKFSFKCIFALFNQLKVPTDLKNYDFSNEVLDDIDNLQGAFNQNPVPFSIIDAKQLVRSLL